MVSEREHETRRSDVTTFFSASTTQLERRDLLKKYGASFVLVPRSTGAGSALASERVLGALGSVAHADDHFLLVRVDSSVRR
jgi:cysteine synthase